MKKRLSRISPVQFGMVLAALYGLLSLIVAIPGAFIFASHNANVPVPGVFVGGFFVILLPILYAVLGFIFGVITAAVYNLVAGITGGIEFTFENVSEE